jgi:tetratricopeptide (TPR) repeat protein
MNLRGDTAGARAIYASVIERTQAPEFMDALAAIEHSAGNEERAKALSKQARALYEKRLADFPEAAAGHALDHFLARHEDAPRALALAEANFRTRPFGESAVSLARARMLAGQTRQAAGELEAQIANGWDTAQAHWVLAESLARAARAKDAQRERAEALRRNPESAKMYAVPS